MLKYKLEINDLLSALRPITLEEMASVRLMNRTDTKFVTTVPKLVELLSLVATDYQVQETCGHRLSPYATTYWDDTERHSMFRQHHCGHSPRMKVRVRTYLDSCLTFLEVKRKDNHGKTAKTRIRIDSPETLEQEVAATDFLREVSGRALADLRPTLSNRFDRITLVNNARTERLTLDLCLHFHNCETGQEAAVDDLVIIELKRDGRQPSTVLPLLRHLRIKPAGFSKYCIGVAMTNASLPQNRFKPRLRRLGKLAASVANAIL